MPLWINSREDTANTGTMAATGLSRVYVSECAEGPAEESA